MPKPFQGVALVTLMSSLVLSCSAPMQTMDSSGGEATSTVPRWAQQAVWYQIFMERFRNGDPNNDPTPADMVTSLLPRTPPDWHTTPWGHDWYRLDDWAEKDGLSFYESVFTRRYGGDLQGVIDKLDYLQELGVTALYLNPINDSPSLHKYDARNYHHIDRNFGPDPRGDVKLMSRENPADPGTWVWTAADRLFLELVAAVHQRGMRIIMDFSWNHTGVEFWAWKDVLAKQAESAYANWYAIRRFDDPATPENEFAYEGWAGVKNMPQCRKVDVRPTQWERTLEGDIDPGFSRHVFDVTRRWLDPNADGDPADGVDGFRLDVPWEIPLGFWRRYRSFVRSINPQAALIGEWWFHDPRPWLDGDVFDSVMNYRWYVPARGFFVGAEPAQTASSIAAELQSQGKGIRAASQRAMMNLAASHDTERLLSSLENLGAYKESARLRDPGNRGYRIGQPGPAARAALRQILAFQFTYIGAPLIYYGDEVGMWGATDPDCRKPMVWADLSYDDEIASPFGDRRQPDKVAPDEEIRALYRKMIELRKAHLDLFVDGDLRFLLTDDDRQVLAYERFLGNESAVVAFNRSLSRQEIEIPVEGAEYEDALSAGITHPVTGSRLRLSLPPSSVQVLIRR